MSAQLLRNRSSKQLLRLIKKLPVKERRLLAEETLKSIRKPGNKAALKVKPRANWSKLFKAKHSDENPPFFLNANDEKEWQW